MSEKNLHQLKYALKFYKQDPETFSRQIAELEEEIEERDEAVLPGR